MNLRKHAQGKQCMIRLPGCHHNDETTVLCHHRSSTTGMGQKEPDVIGAWGCVNCHAVVDGKLPPPEGWTKKDVAAAFAEAIFRTQKELVETQILKW